MFSKRPQGNWNKGVYYSQTLEELHSPLKGPPTGKSRQGAGKKRFRTQEHIPLSGSESGEVWVSKLRLVVQFKPKRVWAFFKAWVKVLSKGYTEGKTSSCEGKCLSQGHLGSSIWNVHLLVTAGYYVGPVLAWGDSVSLVSPVSNLGTETYVKAAIIWSSLANFSISVFHFIYRNVKLRKLYVHLNSSSQFSQPMRKT